MEPTPRPAPHKAETKIDPREDTSWDEARNTSNGTAHKDEADHKNVASQSNGTEQQPREDHAGKKNARSEDQPLERLNGSADNDDEHDQQENVDERTPLEHAIDDLGASVVRLKRSQVVEDQAAVEELEARYMRLRQTYEASGVREADRDGTKASSESAQKRDDKLFDFGDNPGQGLKEQYHKVRDYLTDEENQRRFKEQADDVRNRFYRAWKALTEDKPSKSHAGNNGTDGEKTERDDTKSVSSSTHQAEPTGGPHSKVETAGNQPGNRT